MKVLLLAFAILALINCVCAFPFHTGGGPHIRAILDDFNKINSGVTELDKAIKSFSNKTEKVKFRTLTYNVELSIMRTTDNVRVEKEFNEKDSKSITTAVLKLKLQLEGLLRDLITRKQAIKDAKQTNFVRDNFERLQGRCFPLADVLEDRTSDADSKVINTSIDKIDKSFEHALKELG